MSSLSNNQSVFLSALSILGLGLSFCGSDMGVVDLVKGVSSGNVIDVEPYLGCEFQAGQSLAQVCLKWTYHDEHERFRIPSQ